MSYWNIKLWNISPLCDVAQTSDCGTLVIYFQYKPFMWCRSDVRLWHALSFISCYKPFMWCRPDARLRHYYSCSFLSRSHSDPRLAPSIDFWDFGRTTARLLCYFPMHFCLYVWTHLLICSYASCLHLLYLMSKLSCEYIQSNHLACWFGQILTKAILWMKSLIASPTPRGFPISPCDPIWSLYYLLPQPRNKFIEPHLDTRCAASRSQVIHHHFSSS